MNGLNPQLAPRYLKHLENDVQRYDAWLRTMICAVLDAANQDQLAGAAEPYDFGAWFYGEEGVSLRSADAYAKVAKTYHALQQRAEEICGQLRARQRVSGEDLSVLIDQANVFRKHVYGLETEVRAHLCALDPLTGVFNRHTMMQRLLSEQHRVKRNGHRCAIVLMDIDHFKEVNDHYGHHVGDAALRQTASIISNALRDYDSMYRFGGEEFLICFPYLDLKRAKIAAERLRNKLKSQSIRVERGPVLRLTASFGASLLDAADGLDVSIAHADQALYSAKNAGRDRVEAWGDRA